MTIHVNGNCYGCGLCVNMCPGVFLMTKEGVPRPGMRSIPIRRDWPRRPQKAVPPTPLRFPHKSGPESQQGLRPVLSFKRGA